MYKECLFSSYKVRTEAIKLLDVGIGRTCLPVIPCEYPDKLPLQKLDGLAYQTLKTG